MPEPVYRAVLLFGAPESGKVRKDNGLAACRTSCICRRAICSARWQDRRGRQGSPHVPRAGSARSGRADDPIFRERCTAWLPPHLFDPARDTLVLDGIPRNVNQARILDGDIRVVRVIHFGSSDEDAMVARDEKAGPASKAARTTPTRRSSAAVSTFIAARRRLCSSIIRRNLILEIDALGTPDEVAAAIERGL